MNTVRDGLRWHLIERTPGNYDWGSWLPLLRAARSTRQQVIWDLCHYGWPDDLNIWSTEFVDRFAAFCRGAARILAEESDEVPFFCPVNEISFWAWAGGEIAAMNPETVARGADLKRQLVRAYVAAVESVRSIDRRARFITAEPLIHVLKRAEDPDPDAAERYRRAQFEAHDMISGVQSPELGGTVGSLDIVGVNFYPDNQWFMNGSTIPLGHHAYRPLRAMLREVYERYRRPIFVSETGAEGSARPYWLNHVCGEVMKAVAEGIPIMGICLYPIVDYHGWDNERVCPAGLFSLPDSTGHRAVDEDLAIELKRLARLVASVASPVSMPARAAQ